MSTFIDSVSEKWGRKQQASNPEWDNKIDELSVREYICEPVFGNNMKEYSLTVTYGQVGFCLAEDREHLKKTFLQRLRRVIFSDLYAVEERLTRAYCERDNRGMESALRDLRTEIHG